MAWILLRRARKDEMAGLPESGGIYPPGFVKATRTSWCSSYFLVSLLPETTWSRLLQEVAVGVTVLLIFRASHLRSRLQWTARLGVLGGFVLTLIGSLAAGAMALVGVVFFTMLLATPL